MDKAFVTEKAILLSDLDIVNHANSVKYLEWCLDNVEPNLLLNQKVESFEMNYLKEVSLEDTITIEKSHIEKTTVFIINANNKTSFALQLNFK
jgi:acyl-ACP thioesterase